MRSVDPIPPGLAHLAEAQEGLLSTAQCESHAVRSDRRARLVRAGRWMVVTRGVFDTIPVLPKQRTVPDLPEHPVPTVLATAVLSAAAARAVHRNRSATDLIFDHRRRRAAWAGLLAHGPRAIAVGACALALHGIEGVPGNLVPEVAVPGGVRRASRPPVRLRQFDDGMVSVPYGDERTGDRRIASIGWALAQAVPELPRGHGLAVLDSALHLEAVDAPGLAVAHDLARGRRGVARTHVGWEMADGRAQSPIESMGRWQCIELDVAPHTLQLPVWSRSGVRLGDGDMAWFHRDGRVLVVEMDGVDWHEGSAQGLRRDRDRDNDFLRAGVDVLRFGHEHVRRGVVGPQVARYLADPSPNVRVRHGSTA